MLQVMCRSRHDLNNLLKDPTQNLAHESAVNPWMMNARVDKSQ